MLREKVAEPVKVAAEEKSEKAAPAEPAGEKDVEQWRKDRQKQEADMLCSLNNKEDCVSCGS
jgi:hypothetical protein